MEEAFYLTNRVLTLSFHQSGATFFPRTGAFLATRSFSLPYVAYPMLPVTTPLPRFQTSASASPFPSPPSPSSHLRAPVSFPLFHNPCLTP